ncbi:hypothetical protein [Streptosporangium sp. NPDC003464]
MYDTLVGFSAQLAEGSTTCRCLNTATYWRTYRRSNSRLPFCAACKSADQATSKARELEATYTLMEASR